MRPQGGERAVTDIELPPHIARPRGELVGPMVQFRRQLVAVTSSPPRDTSDPRYDRCTEHRLACDCREAEHAEQLHELYAERREIRDALTALIRGHATTVYVGDDPRPDLECRCQLCEFARSVLGLTPWENRRFLKTERSNG